MNIDKKRLEREKNESLMVGLSIQEAALGRQLESAETRALARCPKYKETNMYWKRVDELVKQHDQLVKTISDRTQSLFAPDTTKEVTYEDVNEFLNQKSPEKKRKFKDMVTDEDAVNLFDVEESIDVVDNVAQSYEVKEEKLNGKKKAKKNVSTSKKRSTRNHKSV